MEPVNDESCSPVLFLKQHIIVNIVLLINQFYLTGHFL